MIEQLKKHYSNLLKLKSRFLYGYPVMVMLYHRINDYTGQNLSYLTVSNSNFEQHLKFFASKYQVLRIDEDWSNLEKKGVVITFDDGYADNLINALPLLEKYNIPAAVFVTTLNVGTTNEFWWDRLSFDYTFLPETFWLPENKQSVSKMQWSNFRISEELKKRSNPEKLKWLEKFETINNIKFTPRPQYRSLSIEELIQLSKHPLITIGVHTENHYTLGDLTFDEQKIEIETNINKLKELGVSDCKYIAFPHGSYNSETFRIMKLLDIKVGFLANNSFADLNQWNQKKVNRLLAYDYSANKMEQFLRKI
jgi:peptidoglycan/xylan/chitin deacetylase (PgdA/CDA1 family)